MFISVNISLKAWIKDPRNPATRRNIFYILSPKDEKQRLYLT